MSPYLKINWYFKTKYSITKNFKEQTYKTIKPILAKIKKKVIIDITFINKEEIKQLNQIFRHTPRATSVLSFPLYYNINNINNAPNPTHLGDIFICPDFLIKPTTQEIIDLISHSTKHLIGKHHK